VTPVDPRIGQDFAGYRIEALIGEGGMGAVYLAEQVRLKRHVALKLLAAQLADDADFRERFIRESQLAAACEHPNVIPIYDSAEDDGVLYIAMRFVEGSDLRSVLKAEGPLSSERTLEIVGQAAGALDAAHARGLVHRDVKPANILIGSADGRVYLTDFGVAKHTAATGLTRTGFFIGTLDYAAPEQIEGKPVTPATDVYALGCVAYQCLAGEPVFVRESDVAVIHAHLLDTPPLLSERRPELPRAVDNVVLRALAKPPGERYATCAELADALRAALEEGKETVAVERRRHATTVAVERRQPATTISPPAASPPAPSSPPRRRPGWLVPLLVALGLALVAGGAVAAVTLLGGGDAPSAATTVTPDPRTITLTAPAEPVTTEAGTQPADTGPADGGATAEAANRTYVGSIDRLLTNSAETRLDLGGLVRDVSANGISFADASDRITAIIGQRQSLQNAVAAVATPAAFVGAAELLRRSIRAAIDDDRAIQSWINARFQGEPGENARYREHVRASARASAAKTRFVTAYDRLRARLLRLRPLKVGTRY
jgi:tRNA A-37 threonylcarbamoyl transferase component Bud32